MSTHRVILASRSPRRRALLEILLRNFEIIPSDAEEVYAGSPEVRALLSAEVKAHAVGAREKGLVIGADTLVAIDDEVLGKPDTNDQAVQMLRRLSGRSHRVLTGLVVWDSFRDLEARACVETDVRFRVLDDDDIERYIQSGESADKAGAYGIQGRASVFVREIRGEYTNVVGLPLCTLARLLREVGLAL